MVNPYNPASFMPRLKPLKIVDNFSSFPHWQKDGSISLLWFVGDDLLKIVGAAIVGHAAWRSSSDYFNFCDDDSAYHYVLSVICFSMIIFGWVVYSTQSNSPYIEVVQELAQSLCLAVFAHFTEHGRYFTYPQFWYF